jgi:hypothetical protein
MIRYGIFRSDMSLYNAYSSFAEARATADMLEELGYSVEVHTIFWEVGSYHSGSSTESYTRLFKVP